MVLTAAHCIDGMHEIEAMGYRDFEFVIGYDIHTNEGTWERLPLTTWFQHPDWDPATVQADVALVRLARPTEIALPALINRGTPDSGWEGALITYVGWGKMDDSSADTSGVKRTVDIPFYALYDFAFLTHDPDFRNVCYGDSGGAAFVEDDSGAMRLAGVNSFIFSLDGNAPMCEAPDAAAGAARVDAYLSWIRIYVDIDAVEEEVESALTEPEEIPAEEPVEEEEVEEPLDLTDDSPDFSSFDSEGPEESSGCSIAQATPHLGLTLLALLGLVRRRR